MLPDGAVEAVFPPGGGFALVAFQERAFGNSVVPTRAGLRVAGRWLFGTGAAYAGYRRGQNRCRGTAPHSDGQTAILARSCARRGDDAVSETGSHRETPNVSRWGAIRIPQELAYWLVVVSMVG
ncbi:hypothetical protein GCM10027089_27610 [Nocardia thraciensis]